MCHMNFWKGIGAGLVVGVSVGMLLTKKKRCAPSRLLQAAGKVLGSLEDYLGL